MVSIFKNTYENIPERNLDLNSYFDGVKNGQWQDEVLQYRANPDPKKKNLLPSVTASGEFENKGKIESGKHSGVICIDVDSKDQICKIDIDKIKEDEYTYCAHQSVGGYGYAIFVKIDPEKHLDAFLGLEKYYFDKYQIVIDKSCKNINRLRFVSYDPFLFLNTKAKTFKKYLKKAEKITTKTFVVKSDFDEMVKQASYMNLFDDYADYIKLAFALCSEFGEEGRNYFHALCSGSSKYETKEADKHYSKAVQRKQSGITIASLYKIFKDNGISLTSEKTEQIKSIAKLAENPKEKLKELGIVDTDGIIDKVTDNSTKQKTEIDLVIDLIKFEKIKFNVITRNFEWNGDKMDDRLMAKFYTLVWKKIDEGLSKDKIFTLLQNRDNSESFNPILDFFEKNKNLQTNNEFEKLKNAIKISNHSISEKTGEKIIIEDYLDVYLKKWLLGLIGSCHGTYSLMVLVLVGEQGIRKTEFFRNLLPEDLKKFYSESNLDDGKDSEILMTQKLLIVDDEFGGKTKKDATKLKRLSSQQTFSIRSPYGRFSEDLERLAVLGGTSNEMEVINDPTGNRRIIPLNITSIDFELYKSIDKNKLFIELYNEWKKNPNDWFLTKYEIDCLNDTTNQNTEIMAEEEILNTYFSYSSYGSMTATDVYIKVEEISKGMRTSVKRIGQALKKLGYVQKMSKKDGVMNRTYPINCKL